MYVWCIHFSNCKRIIILDIFSNIYIFIARTLILRKKSFYIVISWQKLIKYVTYVVELGTFCVNH